MGDFEQDAHQQGRLDTRAVLNGADLSHAYLRKLILGCQGMAFWAALVGLLYRWLGSQRGFWPSVGFALVIFVVVGAGLVVAEVGAILLIRASRRRRG
jgi:hypothetical protein